MFSTLSFSVISNRIATVAKICEYLSQFDVCFCKYQKSFFEAHKLYKVYFLDSCVFAYFQKILCFKKAGDHKKFRVDPVIYLFGTFHILKWMQISFEIRLLQSQHNCTCVNIYMASLCKTQ